MKFWSAVMLELSLELSLQLSLLFELSLLFLFLLASLLDLVVTVSFVLFCWWRGLFSFSSLFSSFEFSSLFRFYSQLFACIFFNIRNCIPFILKSLAFWNYSGARNRWYSASHSTVLSKLQVLHLLFSSSTCTFFGQFTKQHGSPKSSIKITSL